MASTPQEIQQKTIDGYVNDQYEAGFYTDIEQDSVPPGLNEDIIKFISAKKNEPEWMLEWRLKAYRTLAKNGGT